MEKGRKILIVDDERHLGEGLGRVLKQSGCQVSVCTNGAEALARAAQEQFDIILADYLMPVMNGVDLTKQLRENSSTAIIIGMSCHEAAEEFHRAGADGFFRKPLSPDLVRHIITIRTDAGEQSADAIPSP